MSTLYTCQGKHCPLKDEKTGLAIIPPGKPRWSMLLKEEMGDSGIRPASVHLCEACVWTIREMVVP